nr:hypothetical protein GCM10017745_44190 [Saccharothrix mutabilis subsp. capreolus]
MLASAREGRSGVLVLVGEPGIGKSALLGYGIGAAEGFTVARVAGVESERELGFAALHRLLLPFGAARTRLPDPQREALDVAFGLVAGPPPDRFLISLAVLTLLSEVSADAPVLVVCDDAQWVDRASLSVLAFVGRRLLAERVVLVFAARPDLEPDLLADLDHRTLPGLPAADAASLLTGVDRALGLRIAAEAGGNPLVLAELARELDSGATTPAGSPVRRCWAGRCRWGGGWRRGSPGGWGRWRPARGRSCWSWRRSRPVTRPVVRRAAGAVVPDPLDAVVEDAVASGLLVAEPSVWAAERFAFRHPAVRSAVYASAPVGLRRRVHAALAEVTADDRRAWHLAAASAGPDETVAGELERCADRAGARGGHMARSALLAMAARLSPDRPDHDRRQVGAADAAVAAGAVAHARELLAGWTPSNRTPPGCSRCWTTMSRDC